MSMEDVRQHLIAERELIGEYIDSHHRERKEHTARMQTIDDELNAANEDINRLNVAIDAVTKADSEILHPPTSLSSGPNPDKRDTMAYSPEQRGVRR